MPTVLPASIHQLQIQTSSLDSAAANRLLDDADVAFAAGARALIIDFARVEFFDSLGICGLIMLRQRAPTGVRVVLASMTPAGQKIARITYLHDVFDIYADADAAVADLSDLVMTRRTCST